VIVLPAYKAAKTLKEVVGDIPPGHADRILLVDDASADATVSVATALRLDVIRHTRNLGYGGNQKTCYGQALRMGADVVVMLHPDGQYDPAIIPNLCRVIENGEADIVLGSRWLGIDPAKTGMPWWKRIGNRHLDGLWVENSRRAHQVRDPPRGIQVQVADPSLRRRQTGACGRPGSQPQLDSATALRP
jgi:glycosyltransferase involved in cell wall biosynthesis